MKFSLNWIREFVDVQVPVAELAERLTLAGLEVEGVEAVGESLSCIVVGRIESIDAHPDADKLVICQVSDGTDIHQIVTGATNIKTGDVVPVSLPGAVLANGTKIKNSELRGVPSNGMLCSETELGVSDEAAGIWILPSDTPLGVDFVEYAALKDVVLDIGILPNRGDCQSVLGVARDIAAIYDLPFKTPDMSVVVEGDATTNVVLEAPELCGLYTARRVYDVDTIRTPLWMQRRLQVSGIRPISFIVDVTNYVLLELGQPLHAFDAAKLKGGIVVRSAKANETMTTLDDAKRTLAQGQCVIADDGGAIALAGVMGGASTEISPDSVDQVLEAAWFDPVATRATATAHALRTDSAIRFEKGLDINGVVRASDRAAHLIQTLAGATVSAVTQVGKADAERQKISFDINAVNRLIGVTYTNEQVTGILTSLGYEVAGSGEDFTVTVPTWRAHDVLGWQEVAEDIMRIAGVDSIESVLPREAAVQSAPSDEEQLLDQLQTFFIANGFSQVINFSMVGLEDAAKCEWKMSDARTIANPLTPAESVMRETLLPSLLRVVGHDTARQQSRGAVFEYGSVFPADGEQRTHLAGLAYGDWFDLAYRPEDKLAGEDVLRVKGTVLAALEGIGVIQLRAETRGDDGDLHPGQAGTIASLKSRIGRFGQVHPARLKSYGISVPLTYFEIDITEVLTTVRPQPKYKAFTQYPHTRRDIAMVVPSELSYSEISAVLMKKKPKLCKRFFLFDRFESVEHLGADKVSLAFAFVYQDDAATLTDDAVNPVHTDFVAAITAALPIEIR